MKITVNGVPIPVTDALNIQVEVDPAGETLPQANIMVTGGHLDVYRSQVLLIGDNVSIHMFSEKP